MHLPRGMASRAHPYILEELVQRSVLYSDKAINSNECTSQRPASYMGFATLPCPSPPLLTAPRCSGLKSDRSDRSIMSEWRWTTTLNAKQQPPLSLRWLLKSGVQRHSVSERGKWMARRTPPLTVIHETSSNMQGCTCDYNVAVWRNLYPITRIWLGGGQQPRQQRIVPNVAEPGRVSVRRDDGGSSSGWRSFQGTVHGLPTRW